MIRTTCVTALLMFGASCRQTEDAPADRNVRVPVQRAIDRCERSVAIWLHRTGYLHVSFEEAAAPDNPGDHYWIEGRATGQRGVRAAFSYTCSVDYYSGKVLTMDLHQR